MVKGSAISGWLHRAADSDVWWSFKSSPLTVTAATVTFLIVAIAFLSPILAPHTPFDPATLSLTDGLKPPAMLSADGDWAFPLGTDDQGRDILSSIMYGTRLSLVVGLPPRTNSSRFWIPSFSKSKVPVVGVKPENPPAQVV